MRPILTVIGEALVDLLPDGATGEYRARPGGSPFNVAVGLARLGNRTSLMARFADDAYGRLLRSTAAAEGIDLRAAPRAAERTSVAIASVGDGTSVSYEFDIDGTADWQWTAAELHKLSPNTEALHFGSIASWMPPGAARIGDLVRELRARGGLLISFDPNVRPAVLGPRERGAELVEHGVRRAHVVKASREDVAWLYPELAVDDVAERWSRLGVKLVVVTDGADGASAYRRARAPLRRPGRAVTVVDTIGAGDAFTSGLLTGFVRRGLHRDTRLEAISDGTLADIIDEAVLASAITCERGGADPPRLDELVARLGRRPAGHDEPTCGDVIRPRRRKDIGGGASTGTATELAWRADRDDHGTRWAFSSPLVCAATRRRRCSPGWAAAARARRAPGPAHASRPAQRSRADRGGGRAAAQGEDRR